MKALPPNTDPTQKYYLGFYQNQQLTAVLDLIDGYPAKDVVFIGFFMTSAAIQQKGIGTTIINDICHYLKLEHYTKVQLAWVKGNPQSEHFWTKNQFVGIKETFSTASDYVILAERTL